MKKIIKYSEFLADAKTRKSMIYRPGLECVYDSGALPTPLTLPEGSIMHLQNELSAHDVPGTINDWLVDPKALSEAQVRYMIQEALAAWGGEDPRIKELDAGNLAVGDMLFYDRQTRKYCTVKHAAVGAVLADYDKRRYETNYDTFVGIVDGYAHFVAYDDAYSQTGMYQSNTAATACYYRIEFVIEDEFIVGGSIKFSATSGNGSIPETTIMWGTGESLQEILNRFKDVEADSITFSALTDGGGIGVTIGGYGRNILTVEDGSLENCKVFDCSKFAFLRSENPAAPQVGGIFDPSLSWTLLGDEHHNFLGSSAKSILEDKLVGSSTVCLANTGSNYSSRCGNNFAIFKSWASGSGVSIFYADGVNGTTNASAERVMGKTTFDVNVNISAAAGTPQAAMYEYYYHLFNDQSGNYATTRQDYESKYGKMGSLYDAYLMSHMIDPAGNTGIVAMLRNVGDEQTRLKADCMNVNADLEIIPAYPPEYNAKNYGVADLEGFAPGAYYHPEPSDLGLMFRDDIMPAINDNINEARAALLEQVGTLLTNSLYRGSCADYDDTYSWYYRGNYGAFGINSRNLGNFRSRPSLALFIQN